MFVRKASKITLPVTHNAGNGKLYRHTHIGSTCYCCDVCAMSCECGSCSQKLAMFVFRLIILINCVVNIDI